MQAIDQVKTDIERLAPGKCVSSRSRRDFVQIANRNGKYVLTCGWAVEESHDDDYLSYPANYFARGTPLQPWIGYRREYAIAEIDQAAEMYIAIRDGFVKNRLPKLDAAAKVGNVAWR